MHFNWQHKFDYLDNSIAAASVLTEQRINIVHRVQIHPIHFSSNFLLSGYIYSIISSNLKNDSSIVSNKQEYS